MIPRIRLLASGFSLSTLCLLLVASAVCAETRTAEISPAGARVEVPDGVSWRMDEGVLAALGHALSPRIEEDGRLFRARLLQGVEIAFRSREMRGETGSLAPGAGASGTTDGDLLQGEVQGVWPGVRETFRLRGASVKHDLLLESGNLDRLGHGDLRITWDLEVPDGIDVVLREGEGVVFLGERGEFLGRVPEPLVADAGHRHPHGGAASLELAGPSDARVLTLIVDGAWAADPARVFPLYIDPTVSLQPAVALRTGFVDEFGAGATGSIVSGSIFIAGFGRDTRGFAEFDTSGIPDGATIFSVRLRVWMSNHDNPGRQIIEPVVSPLSLQVRPVNRRVSPIDLDLHTRIGPLGAPGAYINDVLEETGPEWCPDSYVLRDYDLGPTAVADLESQLPVDFFTVGFVSEVLLDLDFDHIDYIGFNEFINPLGACPPEVPGTRITLIVEYNTPPICDAGGPYIAPCPGDLIELDGTGSSDPDGDPITYRWTTTCNGTIGDPDAAQTTLATEPGCGEICEVELTVSDGIDSSSCTEEVRALDETPPEILSNRLEEGLCMWSPRHDYLCLGEGELYVTAVDVCNGVEILYAECASDQPDEAKEEGSPDNGDGHFFDDCVIVADGEDLCARVERAGTDPEGRHYGVGLVVRDTCDNAVPLKGTLFVPHDRSGGSGGPDDPCVRGDKLKTLP